MSFFPLTSSWVSIWSVDVLCDHLFAWASKTHSRRCLRWGTFAIREVACGVREQSKSRAGALLAFCVNQDISASFLSSIFLNAKFFPYLFIYSFNHRCRPPEGIPGSSWGWTPAQSPAVGSITCWRSRKRPAVIVSESQGERSSRTWGQKCNFRTDHGVSGRLLGRL